jgi:putative PIN family toxin of toxin-antitoxin system
MQRELSVVLNRPRLVSKYGLSGFTISSIMALLQSRAESTPDPLIVPISRDPRDDIFIAVARAAHADVLVTRDDDLKRDPDVVRALRDGGTQVTSVREFRELLLRLSSDRP